MSLPEIQTNCELSRLITRVIVLSLHSGIDRFEGMSISIHLSIARHQLMISSFETIFVYSQGETPRSQEYVSVEDATRACYQGSRWPTLDSHARCRTFHTFEGGP